MDLKDPKLSEWKRFFRSFIFAWSGIIQTFKTERNFQIHVSISFIMLIVGMLLGFTTFEWVLLLFLLGGMLSLELINTALEHVVDLITPDYHPLAKAAKDAAAGAVLVYAFLSVIIGVIIIWSHLKLFV
ncbi:diacylglycerol kinase family protein [Metabacillus litoralis]|uniref:diacylglycerol kinase n=1 Tax=Metabacillus TaxID=2675233 RepID=UPI000EF5F015|nr:diacylglycerol kinase family protein [Metabacillus litoralis]MCM3161825.1 diacylglycerol kinase family protein [Metabacillus litoralis]MCM3412582.1 diacylglycerol kinase family protein [Metabacillus litoralis]UHA62442.1 diacylglycerol kinase family protein [Metabacillus litoralis]